MYLIGQNRIKEYIKNNKEIEKSFIICGDEDTGKTHIVKYIAQETGRHYQYVDYEVDYGLSSNIIIPDIVIDSDRANTLYHVRLSLSLSYVSQIRKILEIGQKLKRNNMLILTFDSYDMIPEDVKDNFFVIPVEPYTKQECVEFIKIKGYSEGIIAQYEEMNFHNVDTPTKILNEQELHKQMFHEIYNIYRAKITTLLNIVKDTELLATQIGNMTQEEDIIKNKVACLAFLDILCMVTEDIAKLTLNHHYEVCRTIEYTKMKIRGLNTDNRMLIQIYLRTLLGDLFL